MGLRRFGKAAFLVLSDRSGRLQAYMKKDHLGEEAYDLFLKSVDAGDIVWVEGPLFLTRTGELTVEAARFRLLTKSIRPLPEKWHGLTDVETRYRQRYVDLIVNEEVREIFRHAGPDRLLHPRLPGVAGLPRGRDADDAADPGRRHGAPVHDPPQRARHGPVPADRPGALPEAPPGRRVRAGLRDQPELPERGDRHPAQPRVHDAGVLPGLRHLRGHDGADGGDALLPGDGAVRRRRNSPTRGRRSISPRPGSD